MALEVIFTFAENIFHPHIMPWRLCLPFTSWPNHQFVGNNVAFWKLLGFEFELNASVNPKKGGVWGGGEDSQGWKDRPAPHRRKNTHFCFTVTVKGNSWISWTHTDTQRHAHTYTHMHTHSHTRLRFNYSIVRWRRKFFSLQHFQLNYCSEFVHARVSGCVWRCAHACVLLHKSCAFAWAIARATVYV